MTIAELSSGVRSASVNRTGVYLAILQLVFTLGWTTYVIYLPQLAAKVGIAPSAVILVLMLDQVIFTITDTAMGMAADRIASMVGRLGVFVGSLTAISCIAFVALPFVAGNGPGAQGWFIALRLKDTELVKELKIILPIGVPDAAPAARFVAHILRDAGV